MRLPPIPSFTLLILLAVAALAARAADSEPIELTRDVPWRHESSGFVFPQDVVTFTRVSAFRYDDTGHNVSVGYNDRALRVVLTAYVYPNPQDHSLLRHFEQVKHDVQEVHPAAQVVSEGPWKLQQGDRTLTGRRATFAFRVNIGGQEHDVVSEAYLLRLGKHFVKFRVTCPKQRHEAAADRVERFLQSLKIPDPAAARSK